MSQSIPVDIRLYGLTADVGSVRRVRLGLLRGAVLADNPGPCKLIRAHDLMPMVNGKRRPCDHSQHPKDQSGIYP